NVLALTGDLVTAGDQPQAKPVFDIDSVHLLKMIDNLNNGMDLSGKDIAGKTSFFSGAAVDPGADPITPQFIKFKQKIESGSRFFQTQSVFNIEILDSFMKKITQPDVRILGGVLVLKSAKMARFLNENVPGIEIDEATIHELEKDPKPPSRGIKLAVKLVREMREICHGVHIMSIGREEIVPEILKQV
ncbi:MAG: methylenetetrahydrofolate reductase, partial [Candidatus Theseobacter exili]|nr:methylenetetrahydrofolate reductase [Candidatus Theseobacter exili]